MVQGRVDFCPQLQIWMENKVCGSLQHRLAERVRSHFASVFPLSVLTGCFPQLAASEETCTLLCVCVYVCHFKGRLKINE